MLVDTFICHWQKHSQCQCAHATKTVDAAEDGGIVAGEWEAGECAWRRVSELKASLLCRHSSATDAVRDAARATVTQLGQPHNQPSSARASAAMVPLS